MNPNLQRSIIRTVSRYIIASLKDVSGEFLHLRHCSMIWCVFVSHCIWCLDFIKLKNMKYNNLKVTMVRFLKEVFNRHPTEIKHWEKGTIDHFRGEGLQRIGRNWAENRYTEVRSLWQTMMWWRPGGRWGWAEGGRHL